MKRTLFKWLIFSFILLIVGSAMVVSADAVTIIEAVAVSSDSVKLSWTVRENANGYLIERYEKGKWRSTAEISDNKQSTYIVNGLKPGTDYYFRLKYYIIRGKNKQYFLYGEAIRCTTSLPTVTGFSASADSNSVRLVWNTLTGCDGYELQRLSGTKWTRLWKFTGSEKEKVTITKLKEGKEYDFRIRAYKDSSSGTIYGGYSYITCTATDKQSVTIFGPNLVYTGESFNYTYCIEGDSKAEIKWTVMGGCGKITENGKFTATKNGDCTVVATGSTGSVYSVLSVHCVNSADDVGFLPLVNGINIANKTYPVPRYYDPKGLTAETEKAFETMKKGALKDGIVLRSISDYRSYKTQVNTYNYWKKSYGKYADSFSAKPGFSEHQLGLAIDVNDMWASFADTKEGKWLEENCYKYGFILRYPSYASEISTGYEYEPWHIRYLGKKLAKKVHFSGSTLEEYLGIDSSYR